MQRRCYEFSGMRRVRRRVVEENGNIVYQNDPIRGFATRFAHYLERHGARRVHIHNGGLDATPIQFVLDCLHTHLPTRLDAIILEPGSMAKFSNGEELRRVVDRLHQMKPTRPSLIFVIFHEWFGQRTHRLYDFDENTPWRRMERAALELCREHNAACISPRHDLYARVEQNRSLLAQYVGPDGLHIVNSRLGIDHTTKLIVRWWEHVLALPVPPMDSVMTHQRPPPATRCYRFGGHTPQRFALAPWTTGGECSSCPPLGKDLRCESSAPVWRYCTHVRSRSDSGRARKFSPALVGIHANATLEVTLDTAFSRGDATIVLQYLTSRSANTGAFTYRCSSCACESGEISAHNAALTNSIFTNARIVVSQARDCHLKLTVRRPEIRIRYAYVEIS